jgi:hypothetical protein
VLVDRLAGKPMAGLTVPDMTEAARSLAQTRRARWAGMVLGELGRVAGLAFFGWRGRD